jgi:NADPH:quinone reductase-like Zn-dependent oxidoreductase
VGKPLAMEMRENPPLAPGEAWLRLRCAALNHRDVWIRQGAYAGIKLPCVLGSDGCGEIEAVGSEADAAWVGKQAVVFPSLDWGGDDAAPGPEFRILGMPDDGTFAESIRIPVSQLFPAPRGFSPEESAALPLAGLTSHRALFRRGGLKAGEKVLITGVGGGAAQFLMQFAVAAGAEVWVTSGSPEKISAAGKKGAKGGALYTSPGWAEELAKAAGAFDLCVDSAGGEGWTGLCDLLRPGGRLVFFGVTRGLPEKLPLRKAFFKQLSFLGTTMGSPGDFQAMLDFVQTHRLRPVVDSVWPWENSEAAFRRMESGAHTGKIVLKIS